MLTLTITLEVPESVGADLHTWLFENFTNVKLLDVTKQGESAFVVHGLLQDKLLSVPQLMDDNIKLADALKLLREQVLTASETIDIYRELNIKGELEVARMQDQLVRQGAIIEKLARDNAEQQEDVDTVGGAHHRLLTTLESEKQELLGQGRKLVHLMQMFQREMAAANASSIYEYEQPFV